METLIIYLFFILIFMFPALLKLQKSFHRQSYVKEIEKIRGTRVITLIHRQETVSFLGIPVIKYITLEDAEDIVRAIKLTKSNIPIDLIIHTPGGLVVATEQITNALRERKGKVTVIIPHLAMSGGTLIAISANEILMDRTAIMGPIDPQVGGYPAASVIKALEIPNPHREDQFLVLGDVARKAMVQMRGYVYSTLRYRYSEDVSNRIAEELTKGQWTHDFPITSDHAKELGLNVVEGVPHEVFKLMSLYKTKVSTTVDYIKAPYIDPPRKEN